MKTFQLRPIELTSAGIMAGLTVVLGLVAAALPVLDQPLKIASALPIALIALRFSPAAAGTAVVAATSVGFGLGGVLTAFSIVQYALMGWMLGVLLRRGSWFVTRMFAVAALAVGITAAKFGLLVVFSESRNLALEAARASLTGYLDLLKKVSAFEGFAESGYWLVDWLMTNWWVWLPIQILFFTLVRTLIASWLLRVVVRRINFVDVVDRFVPTSEVAESADGREVAPLPLRIESVWHRYHDEAPWAVRDVSLTISDGEFMVIAGANGSGKSTLAAILAGASSTRGKVCSPGKLGRGLPGGLAYLSQSADVHVIGGTVRDDVVWGFDLSDPDQAARVNALADECLLRVGLSHLAQASTRHLSGGELQRLALASALMRQPRIIISDETTAMIDPEGRRLMMDIFSELSRDGVAVVHITHDPAEAARATRLVRLEGGRLVWDGRPLDDAWVSSLGNLTDTATFDVPQVALPRPSSESLWVRDVTHIVNERTPWEREVLSDIAFIIEPGTSVLITGANGSGKTTLARLMTGLGTPSYGQVTLGKSQMLRRVGDVSMSHQFARLQLLRPTVGEDIIDAIGHAQVARGDSAGTSEPKKAKRLHDPDGNPIFTTAEQQQIDQALSSVGLPAHLATRRIDELSGGQQRRVALAGLIAARPALLILDEPFAGLDTQSRHLLVNVLTQLREGGMSLVLISHDDDGLHALADRHYQLRDGRIEGSEPTPRVRGQRYPDKMRFPQPLPWSSPVSAMWAGSKVLAWASLLTVLLFFPSWVSTIITAFFLAVMTALARMPRRALPNLPAAFWSGILGGFIGASLSGGFLVFLKFTLIMMLFLWGTSLLLLTTSTQEFTQALSTFFHPLRRLWVNVPMWIHAMTLSIRSVPMLLDQSRALQDTMTIRLYRQSRVTTRSIFAHFVDVATASLASAAYRAELMGTAISMRGGIPNISPSRPRLTRYDAWLIALTIACLAAMITRAALR